MHTARAPRLRLPLAIYGLAAFNIAALWIGRRRFRAPAWLLWACILSSPALVSQSIVGLPHLTSAAIPFGLAIGWVLTETDRCRGVVAGLLLDTLVFATITFIAFNGYESGKTF